jgi:hypothetical protein
MKLPCPLFVALVMLGGCSPRSAHRSVEPNDAAVVPGPEAGAGGGGVPPADSRAATTDDGSSVTVPDAAGGTTGNVDAGTAPTDVAPPPPPDAAPLPTSLPVVVTSVFGKGGWIGDDTVRPEFHPGSTLINQISSTAGPCAARAPMARGKCLEIVYTPPPGLVPPAVGAYVGIAILSALAHDHPEVVPPLVTGDANWGAEPGLPLPLGATQISFLAASADVGLQVAFKAGIGPDSFSVAESRVPLTATWTRQTLPLTGQYQGVYSPFIWVLSDTTRPARFYLDDVVWQ